MFGRKPRVISPDLVAFTTYLKVSRNLADGTVAIYVRVMERYLTDRPADLARWLERIATSASTFTQACSGLKAWGKFRRDKTLLGELEDVDRPKKPRSLPKPVADVPAKLAALGLEARWAAVFLKETGCRISEAYSIVITGPIPDQLLIRGKGSKDRLVLLTPNAREALTALGGRLPWSKRWLQREFQKVGTHAHAWRHTLGCELAEAGCDLGEIQEILGHSNPSTTRGYAAYGTDRLWAAQNRRSAYVAQAAVNA